MTLAKSSAVLQSVTATVLVSFACSCVNEAYDLSKDIDGTMDIQGSISLPIGSTEFMPIGDFLELDQDDQTSSILTTDENGDYRLSVKSDKPIVPDEPISIPEISIDASQLLPDPENPGNAGGFKFPGIRIGSEVNDIIQGLAPDKITDEIVDYLNSQLPPVSEETVSTPISINERLSDDITGIVKDIREIQIDAPIELSIAVEGENLHRGRLFLNGPETNGGRFDITFPDFVVLEGRSSNVTVEDGHILTFNNLEINVENPETSSFSFAIVSIDMNALKEGQGYTDGTLYIEDNIELSSGLRLSLDPRDFVENGTISVPDEITIDMSLNAGSEIAVKSVTAALDLGGYGIEPTEVSIGELPDFLSGDNVTLDLYNPVIRLDVLADEANTPDIHFPEFTLSASLDAFGKDGQSTMDSPISLNDIAISKGMNHVIISRLPVDRIDPVPQDEHYVYREISNLSDIIKVIPDHITISEIEINTAEEYTTVVFPQNGAPLTYDVSVDYSIDVPLAFGKDLNISYSTEFDGWNENFSSTSDSDYRLDLREATIRFDFINSIPLELGLSAEAIDIDGNVMDDIDVSLEGTLAAGNTGSETSTPIIITIRATQEALDRFDGLRLNIEATSGDMEGVTLNKNQGIRLENISANIQGGVQLEIF